MDIVDEMHHVRNVASFQTKNIESFGTTLNSISSRSSKHNRKELFIKIFEQLAYE